MRITFVNIGLYIFQALIFYYYCNSIFNSKFKKITRMLCILAGFTVLFFVFLLGKVYINGIVVVLTIFLIVHFVYGERILSSMLQAILYLALLAATEYMSIPIVNIIYKLYGTDYHNDFHGYLFMVLISKTLHFISTMILILIFNRNKKKTITNKGMILTLTVLLSNVAILIMVEYISRKTEYNREMNIVWGVIAGLLLLLTFLLLFNRSYLINQADKIYELNIENQKKELDEQYFSVLEKSNDDMQILAHDFKNHLSYVRNLDSAEEKDKYIDKIYPEIEKFQQTASTGNKTLDVILSKYTSICELKAVSFKADVKNANLSQMESVDLIALLNNLLDNAVEAAEQSAAKRITLTLVKGTQFIDKLVIANSCDTAPAQSGDKLLTRKKEGALHGTGLKSVKKVCEQCGANYAWEYDSEKQLFTTTVLMPKEQKSN